MFLLKIILSLFALLFFIIMLFFLIGFIDYKIAFNKAPIDKLYEKRKKQNNCINIKEIPYDLINTIVLLEDINFFIHNGVIYENIFYALIANIKAHSLKYGGSTITMQLCKNLYSRFDKKIIRKTKEFFMAKKVEKVLNKNEILEFYLNIIYFGNGQYGIYDASYFYFNKNPKDLTYIQIFLLAALIPSPYSYNPFFYIDKLINKMFTCAKNLHNHYLISEEHYYDIINLDLSKLNLTKPNTNITKFNTYVPLINEKYNENLK